MNPSALQRYMMQKDGYQDKFGPGDAEYIDDDIYAGGATSDAPSLEPTGLVDRLGAEQLDGLPIDDPELDPRKKYGTRLPTTKGAL